MSRASGIDGIRGAPAAPTEPRREAPRMPGGCAGLQALAARTGRANQRFGPARSARVQGTVARVARGENHRYPRPRTGSGPLFACGDPRWREARGARTDGAVALRRTIDAAP